MRQPHAALNLESRSFKARKIEMLLGLNNNGNPLNVLEIGCGSGGISHYFGTHPSCKYQVYALDVTDSRVVHEGYDFQTITDTALPFPDDYFDVVISNHVIEHVGDEPAQVHHLKEFGRVLKPSGIGYLAMPNRWMLVEPHYRLPFLSWLPVRWRSPYLHFFRNAEYYDCRPLELGEAEQMLADSGVVFENICVEGIRAVFLIEGTKGVVQYAISMLPDRVLALMNPINPTLIYRITK